MKPVQHVYRFLAMASPCTIQLACERSSSNDLLSAAKSAAREIARIERRYSRYSATSLISQINGSAGDGHPVEIDEETSGLLGFADRIHTMSGGLFDPTSGVLRRAWNFKGTELPTRESIRPLLDLVGWHHVDRTATSVRLSRAGMELDFGGFVKEYAADRAVACLMACGLAHGFVNLGGDIRVLGPQPDGSPWQFGVADPRRPRSLICTMLLSEGALATSGDYERFIDVDGVRYCHVLDPRTGWPPHHWQAVSVVSSTCIAAGAMSTIAMLMGPHAEAFLAAQNVAWFGVKADGTVSQA